MLKIDGLLRGDRQRDRLRRSTIIALVSFLTLIDLFGSQALLPRLIEVFDAPAGTVGFAVNAATMGMAISGLTVAWFADRINRKRGIWVCLALLSLPTFMLGFTHDIWVFMSLRVVQGMLMAAAFTLSMTYISEQCDIMAARGAMAAYITGNVASNLFGRIVAVFAADLVGVSGSFITFSVLNILGACAAYFLIGARDTVPPARLGPPLAAWKAHLSNAALRKTFAIGFIILFVFVGVFTYINLHLVDVLGVPAMALGLVYLVFLPALLTTPMAGSVVARVGPRTTLIWSLLVAASGLALTVVPNLPVVLGGLAVVGAAAFFAQAASTGFLSATVTHDRAAANGLYLTSYYLGGLVGALVLGQINSAGGWVLTASAIGASMAAAMMLVASLKAVAVSAPTTPGNHVKD